MFFTDNGKQYNEIIFCSALSLAQHEANSNSNRVSPEVQLLSKARHQNGSCKDAKSNRCTSTRLGCFRPVPHLYVRYTSV